jgi:peptide/nickel transport system substrate-binding protein
MDGFKFRVIGIWAEGRVRRYKKYLTSFSHLYKIVSKMKILPLLVLLLLCFSASCGRDNLPPDTMVIAMESDPTNLDPRLATDAASSRLVQLIFSGLVRQDEKGLILPDLAEKWEVPDPLTYRFTLRRGVRFHDGSPLTSEDVKYTFASILDPATASPHRSTFEKIERIETPDPRTVIFRLREPFAPFLLSLTMGIVPEKTASETGSDFSRAPIGTGPFLLSGRTEGDAYTLTANPHYFGGTPKLAHLIFRIIPDNTVRFLELRKGTVQLIMNGIELDYLPLVRKDPNLKLMTGPGVNYSYIGFNLKDPILAKRAVREAIAHAVDRRSIIHYLLRDTAHRATGLLSRLNWAYNPEVPTYNYDPARSRALLDEAGYPDPDGDGPAPRFTLTFKTSQDELRKRIAAALQQQLKEVGIEIRIRSYEWGTFYGDIKAGNFQLYTLSWVGITEPDIYYYIFYSKNVPPYGANRGHYDNEEVDTLLSNARVELNLETRRRDYAKVQAILAYDLPYVSLWHYDNVAVMQKNVRGFVLDPSGGLFSLKNVWLQE